MTGNFTELFDKAEAGELEELLADMKCEPMEKRAAKRIRTQVLARTGLASQRTKKEPRRWRVLGTLAACLALVLALGTYAYAAENRTYNEAVRFFSENSLSTEGLTRGEIKAVYRDITTESFTYAKTAEVILNTARVEGYSIPQEVPDKPLTREETIDLWAAYNLGLSQTDVHYSIFYTETTEENGVRVDERSIISKRDGQTLLWQFTISAYIADSYRAVSDGVIVWGRSEITDSRQNQYAWMTKLDDDGHEVWTRCLDDGFRDEYICAVVEEEGGYAVISRGDFKTVCFSRYTADGQRTMLNKTDLGNYGVTNAARLGDGYLVQISSYINNEHARIVRLDGDGNLIDDFSYSAEDAQYYIADMAEFGGKVYLSSYAVPLLADDESGAGGRHEIAAVLNELYERFESGGSSAWDISDEELTPMVRANYTAVLLVCDPRGGEPETFYSVEGSLGGKLSVSDRGELTWDVESIASTFFSPATSSFTIGGMCQVYRYAFDGSGTLLSQVKTDETTVYRR